MQLIADGQMQGINSNLAFNSQQDPVCDAKTESFAEIAKGIETTIVGTIFCVILSMLIFHSADNITRISIIPFLICGLSIFIRGILMIIKGIHLKKRTDDFVNGNLVDMDKVAKKEKVFSIMEVIANNIYVFGFLLFWFGFLIIFDTIAIQSWSNGGNRMFFGSLIFWAAGIFVLITKTKKIK